MIHIENLTKKFGSNLAVDNLSLDIEEGEVFGLFGPNGAGKTTTIRMLGCLITKTSGRAIIDDYETDQRSNHQKIRKLIGFLPENVGLYEDLSAFKNLDFYGKYYKVPNNKRKENIEYYMKGLGLWDKRNEPAGKYSKGMKQKLAIARVLIHEPQILFLDEPTANLDPESAKVVIDYLLELKKEQKTIILNTHMLDEAEKICDRVGVLKTKLLAVDSPKRLQESLHGKKTIVQLQTINEKLTSALKKAGPWNFELKNNQIVIDVQDPDIENPSIVDLCKRQVGEYN